jgi:hypothetical protein
MYSVDERILGLLTLNIQHIKLNVRVCVRERKKCVCVCERERESVCVCVRERERERKSGWVWVSDIEIQTIGPISMKFGTLEDFDPRMVFVHV